MTLTLPPPGQILKTFGGQVDVRVEIDTGLAGSSFGIWGVSNWGEATWGSADPAWNDITQYVTHVTIDRGISKWGERFQAGTASITLNNETGVFSPEAGVNPPWHLPFRPGRRIRVIAIPDPTQPLVKEALITGEIDASYDAFSDAAFDVTITLPVTDSMATWADHNPPALETATGVQDTDTRVGAALDRMTWPAGLRDIQTGLHTLQSSFLAQSTLEECMIAAEAEGGAFFCSRDGKATFKARDWLSIDTRSIEIQGFLGYEDYPSDSNGHGILDLKTSTEISRVVNQVRFARVGSSMQEVNDTASQALFDIRSYPRTDFQNNLDSEVLFLATRYLSQFKAMRLRVEEVTIAANEDPNNDDLNHLFYAAEFGDLLSVLIKPPYDWQVEKLVKIMGIHHEITADDWEVTFRLDDVFVFVGGSIAQVVVDPQGGGENPNREGGSIETVNVDPQGGGAIGKSGGSTASVSVVAEGEGTIPRAPLMGLLDVLAWWRFVEDADENFWRSDWGRTDATGDGSGDYVLTLPGGNPTGGSDGPIPGGDEFVTLNGTDKYFGVDPFTEADLELRQDMSIEMWVRGHSGGSGTDRILSCGATDDPLYEVRWSHSLDTIFFAPTTSASGSVAPFGGSFGADEWVHIVVTIDWTGAGRTIRFYVNGEVNNGNTNSYLPNPTSPVVNIGRRAGNADNYFDGDISELTVFDRVLTADEVRQLYESTYLGGF